jgi:hypothetical protein
MNNDPRFSDRELQAAGFYPRLMQHMDEVLDDEQLQGILRDLSVGLPEVNLAQFGLQANTVIQDWGISWRQRMGIQQGTPQIEANPLYTGFVYARWTFIRRDTSDYLAVGFGFTHAM